MNAEEYILLQFIKEWNLLSVWLVMLALHNSTNWINIEQETVHEGKKPFKCDTCHAGFTKEQKLREHYEFVHEGTKPY